MTSKKDDAKDRDVPSFAIAGESSSFKSKTDSIFGCLDVLEKKHSAVEKVRDKHGVDTKFWKSEPTAEPVQSTNRRPNHRQSSKHIDSNRKHTRSVSPPISRRSNKSGRDDRPSNRGRSADDFKVPFLRPPPPPRSRNVPGFRKEPEKWKKYTLSDVGSDQLTDRANAKAAFGFLDELRKRRQSELTDGGDDDLESGDQKITFKKPRIAKSRAAPSGSGISDDSSGSSDCKDGAVGNATPFVYGGGKIVQAEYQVGKHSEKTKKTTSAKTKPVASSDVVSLSHLMDDDDDEDESDD